MRTHNTQRTVMLAMSVLGLAVVAGIVLSTHLRAQSTGTGATAGTSSSSVTSTSSAPADAPPVVSLSVLSANPQVSGFRPGVRAYYTTTITDDQSLKSVVVTTSSMMYSGSSNTMYQCPGKTLCEEKVYVIVPANAGAHFVTVTAIDSANQVTVKTVTFNADACSTDAQCGGGEIQWAGASYCGSEAGSGPETDIMQYGVGATCKSGGICDTSSVPRVKQKCASDQACTFGLNGVNLCVTKPTACTPGAPIASLCTCGYMTLNYPNDWRINSPTYHCCANTGPYNNASYSTYGGPCPGVSGSSTSPVRAANSSSLWKPAAGSASTVPVPAHTGSSSMVIVPGTTSAAPSGSAYTPVSPSNPSSTSATALPGIVPGVPSVVPGRSQQPIVTQTPSVAVYRKLSASKMRVLRSKKKSMLKELMTMERIFKIAKDAEALEQLSEFRADLEAFVPLDGSAYELMTDFQDEIVELRLQLPKKQTKSRK